MTDTKPITTKFFSSVQPKVYPLPARQLQVGDEWHHDEVIKVWNGTAWVVPCKGKNCKSIDGKNHSAECIAEHEATVDAGKKQSAADRQKEADDKEEQEANAAAAEKAQRDAADARKQELAEKELGKRKDETPAPKADEDKKGGAPAPSHKKGGAK